MKYFTVNDGQFRLQNHIQGDKIKHKNKNSAQTIPKIINLM